MSLRNFPFDIDDVSVAFYSNSHYVTLDWEEQVHKQILQLLVSYIDIF